MRIRPRHTSFVPALAAAAALALVSASSAHARARMAPPTAPGAVCVYASDGTLHVYVTDPDCWTGWDTFAGAPAVSAGMLAGKEPESGRIGMPTAEQIDELRALDTQVGRSAQLMRASHEGLTIVSWPDGSRSMDLEGRLQEYTVIRLGADGASFSCVPLERVNAALAAKPRPATTPAPREVR